MPGLKLVMELVMFTSPCLLSLYPRAAPHDQLQCRTLEASFWDDSYKTGMPLAITSGMCCIVLYCINLVQGTCLAPSTAAGDIAPCTARDPCLCWQA